ncbi:MAG TPA: hypothetical protein VN803_01275, partial [Gemmatimonadales bacterium]|nr:hypothetical protein [Gemmatimonadales bacterium]
MLAIPLALACDSPFEPKGDGERIPIGVVINQDVTQDSARLYSLATSVNAVYAVYLQALEGSVWLRVLDSTGFYTLVNMTASPVSGRPRLEDNAVSSFAAGAAPSVYQIVVQQVGAGTTASFRFKIDLINPDPEHVPVEVAIGDTVVGETIAPKVDIDRFVMMGDAGQEIVLVGETPAPVGSGSVAFSLVDTAGQGLLGYVFADAGPPTLTSGLMRLPATRGYAIDVGSVTSNTYPRYSGPYRFWTYAINRAPEHRAAPIAFNTEISQETIDREGDIDEFTFQATAGDEFNVFVQAPRAFALEVMRQGAAPFAVATAAAADTALYKHSTGRFTASQSGTHVVRVSGSGTHQIGDTGKYRVYVYDIDRQPEHVPAAIAIGDTISGEQIELPGDIDEFTFAGNAGDEINAFFQAEDGSQETYLQLEVLQPSGMSLSSVQSIGTDTSLLRQASGTFVLASSGTHRVRVQSSSTYMDRSRGPYRFFLYRISRNPESAPALLALGDSITGEAIDLPGDIDEFTLTASASTLAGFALARAGLGPCLRVAVVAGGGQQILNQGVPAYCGTTTEMTLGTGPFVMPQGSHTLRVQGVAST